MVGVDFKVKTLVIDGKRTKLSIWVSPPSTCPSVAVVRFYVNPSGHSRTGAVSYTHTQLLQRSTRGYPRYSILHFYHAVIYI